MQIHFRVKIISGLIKNVITMENYEMRLHLKWKSEGISIKALTEILNHFDSLNSHLEQHHKPDAKSSLIIKEVRKGSIEFILLSTAVKSIPAIWKLFKDKI